jgi:hypothetical protein
MKLKKKKYLTVIIMLVLLSSCNTSQRQALSTTITTSAPVSASSTPMMTNTPTEVVETQGSHPGTSVSGCKSAKLPPPEVYPPYSTNSEILLMGHFNLCLEGRFTFDLDRGVYDDHDVMPIPMWESENYRSETDIGLVVGSFSIPTNTINFYLTDINGARINYNYEKGVLSPLLCAKYDAAAFQYPSIDTEIGKSGCVVTNEGRIATVRVVNEDINSAGMKSVEITFVTYNVFVPEH